MSVSLHALKTLPRSERYETLLLLVDSQLHAEKDRVATLSNLSSLMMGLVDDLNWAGFYLFIGEELVLGPFQGEPACHRIPIGEGVCGKAFASREVIKVDDVLTFPGHIACDRASRSELVCPIVVQGEPVAVIDWDSPHKARFTEDEVALIKGIAELIAAKWIQLTD